MWKLHCYIQSCLTIISALGKRFSILPRTTSYIILMIVLMRDFYHFYIIYEQVVYFINCNNGNNNNKSSSSIKMYICLLLNALKGTDCLLPHTCDVQFVCIVGI